MTLKTLNCDIHGPWVRILGPMVRSIWQYSEKKLYIGKSSLPPLVFKTFRECTIKKIKECEKLNVAFFLTDDRHTLLYTS